MYKIEGPEDGGKAPKGPNFLLIVVLFGVTIVIGFAIALLVTGHIGRSIHVVHPDSHPSSRLSVPSDGSEAA
jgi:hypothetical protein